MFISGIKPPQKRTDRDKISYFHKYLKSLYYRNKWVLKMKNYSVLSECFDFSLTSTEKKNWAPKNLAETLKIKTQ
jgi:hypothetical protein